MRKAVIVGGGGHARVIASMVRGEVEMVTTTPASEDQVLQDLATRHDVDVYVGIGRNADRQRLARRVRQLDRSACVADEIMSQPGRGRTGLDRTRSTIAERLAQNRVEEDPWSFRADRELDSAVAALGTDIEPPAPDEGVTGDQREVQEHLHRCLGELVVLYDPAELDPLLGPEQAFESGFRLVRVNFLAEPAGGAECQPEKLQLVGRCARAVRQQFEALFPHLGISFIGQQLNTVV